MNLVEDEIDFVVFWVDGNDPVHMKKRQKYLSHFSLESEFNEEQSTSDLRFIEHQELKYCLRSIKQHAPWYHRIFIIVDQQVPSFLDPAKLAEERIELVEHRELFSDCQHSLPTFNSRAIASRLHKLDRLSKRFLVGNDDVMLSASIQPDFFFAGNKPRVYADWHSIRDDENVTLHRRGILNAANLMGFTQEHFLLPSHGFMPLDKFRLALLESQFPNEFQNNIAHRFRHESQFLVEALYNHYCVSNDQCILRDTGPMVHFSFELCRIGTPEKVNFLFDLLESGQRKMFCINEYQSLIPRIPELEDRLKNICGPVLQCERKARCL